MADIKTDIKEIEETDGEKLFNRANYWGLGGLANAGVGVVSTEFAFNRPGNPLYSARETLVKAAVETSNRLINDPELEKLTATIGQRLGDDLGKESGKYKQAFYDLYKKFNGYEGIAAQLNNEISAEEIKKAADYMIKKQTSNELFNTGAVLATLCIGGFVVMVPMKYMEDNKRFLVEQLDRKIIDPLNEFFGKAPKTEEEKQELEEKRQKRYAEIELEPKQTWGSMFVSRVGSLIPIYLLHAAWWNQNNAIKHVGGVLSGEPITNPDPEYGFGGIGHYAKKIGDVLGKKIHSGLSEESNEKLTQHIKEHAQTFYNNHKEDIGSIPQKWICEKAEFAATDVIYSLASATGTYYLTRLFAQNKEKEKDNEKEKPQLQVDAINHNGAMIDIAKGKQFSLAFT